MATGSNVNLTKNRLSVGRSLKKVGIDVGALSDTTLRTQNEVEALTKLAKHVPDLAKDLATRAIAGEDVSARGALRDDSNVNLD
jgi:hypothetical protein